MNRKIRVISMALLLAALLTACDAPAKVQMGFAVVLSSDEKTNIVILGDKETDKPLKYETLQLLDEDGTFWTAKEWAVVDYDFSDSGTSYVPMDLSLRVIFLTVQADQREATAQLSARKSDGIAYELRGGELTLLFFEEGNDPRLRDPASEPQ